MPLYKPGATTMPPGEIGCGDLFDISNLNRQLLGLEDHIGSSKAEEAAKWVKKVNAAVRTTVCREFSRPENLKN